MKYSKIAALILAIALLATLLVGCGKAETTQPTATTEVPETTDNQTPSAETTEQVQSTAITVKDASGKEITIEKPAEKIVVLTASDAEILYAIGAGSTVIGRGTYCNYPEEVLSVTEVNSGYDTNIEQIIGLQPDLVLMTSMAQSDEQVAAIEKAGIPVCITNMGAETFESVYDSITLIGALTGKNAEAEAVIESMKTGFSEIAAKTDGKDTEKTVYFEVSPLEYGLWTAGNGTFMNELCGLLGVKNAFADIDGWAQISEEQVLGRDPDYIVTISMYYGEGPTPVEEIESRDGWDGLKAIINGNVYNADSDEISRPGPRLVDAAIMLYDFIYGESAN